MKYPCLVPKCLCKTDIHVIIYSEGLSEDGEPQPAYEADLKCNFQGGAKSVLTEKQKKVEISGTALIPGDVAERLAAISDGEVWVGLGYKLKPEEELFPNQRLMPGTQGCVGEVRKIAKGTKCRNPDGTVNYTRLDLI